MTTTASTRGSNGHRAPDVIESKSPATGEILGTVPVAGADEVAAAVARARQAASRWAEIGHAGRRAELAAWRRGLAGLRPARRRLPG
ncbi:MAG TPA: aldehyde dehydrogenase family protein, partial [Candidatus Acidoferrum sp.]|nr:aldehyde dehydrogenase family protein [Candidatus Acidoferrum sp.]